MLKGGSGKVVGSAIDQGHAALLLAQGLAVGFGIWAMQSDGLVRGRTLVFLS